MSHQVYLLVLLVFTGGVNSFQCEDDIYRNCEHRARSGECEGRGQTNKFNSANWMLAQCRASCRNQYTDSALPGIIQTYGGLEDHVVDVFGFKMSICPENGGFTTDGRQTIQHLMALNEEQPDWVPKFTKVGFEKTKIPSDLYTELLREYQRVKQNMVLESCAKAVINCEEIIDDEEECSLRTSRRTFIMNLNGVVLDKLKHKLHPLAEAWAGVQLKHEATYGIRRYTNGSWLTSHVDRFNTHVISAILNIGQSVSTAWPLYIVSNDGTNHAVTMEPGEMVWYESARAVHGRPEPLEGEYYDNLFIHYRPVGDWYSSPYEIGRNPRRRPITAEDIRRKQH